MTKKIQIDGAYNDTMFKMDLVAAVKIQINLGTAPGLFEELPKEGNDLSRPLVVGSTNNTGL